MTYGQFCQKNIPSFKLSFGVNSNHYHQLLISVLYSFLLKSLDCERGKIGTNFDGMGKSGLYFVVYLNSDEWLRPGFVVLIETILSLTKPDLPVSKGAWLGLF